MIKLFKRLTVKEVSIIVLSVLFTFLTVFLELEVPTYISTITELLQTPGTVLADLWGPGLKMLGLSFASLLSAIVVGGSSSCQFYAESAERYFQPCAGLFADGD